MCISHGFPSVSLFPFQHQRLNHNLISACPVGCKTKRSDLSCLFMSHHAPCSNLLMLLTCLSHSPSLCFCHLLLSSYLLLTLPPSTHGGRWNERGRTAVIIFLLHLKTRDWMSEGWGHPGGWIWVLLKSSSTMSPMLWLAPCRLRAFHLHRLAFINLL